MKKLYELFDKFESSKDFSDYLTLKFVPVSDNEKVLAFNAMFGNVMKSTLYYCYQFYKIYGFEIKETLSGMNYSIEENPDYNEKEHEKGVILQAYAMRTFIKEFL
jgi:hypothetical protein